MIVIQSFKEAHSKWQQGEIPFRLLQDQAGVLSGLCQQAYRPLDNALKVTEDDIGWLLQQPESSMSYASVLGGYIHICASETDLLEVVGCDFDFAKANGRWPNITEVPLAFDDCKFLEEQSGEAQWAQFLTCWNDAGGSVYYVPRHLWQAANVQEHIAATDGFWQGDK